tara:strand:+ start:2031 stop:3221 length:1191 start_codon:yes stop_codon:yes gene_type:complete
MIDCICCGKKNSSKFLFSNFGKNNVRFNFYPRDVFLCKNCGIIFLKQEKNLKKKIKKYYEKSNHFLKPGFISDEQKKRRVNQVNWILSNIEVVDKINSVADFGSGSGYFLKVFKDKGFKNLLGLDFSKKMNLIAKKKYKIKSLSGDFLRKKIKKKYDLITCIQTLEHLLNPIQFVIKAKKTLSENGYLFLEVPDSEFPKHNQLPEYFTFDHLFHFTEKSLSFILEKNGFEIITVSHLDNKPNSGNPFRVLRILAKKNKKVHKRYFFDPRYYKYIEKLLFSYRKKHYANLKKIKGILSKILKKINNNRFAIYCAGEHTNLLLLRFSKFFRNLSCIYDGDKYVEGKKILNVPILHHSKIKKNNKIKNFIISSTNHEADIFKDLKKINSKFNVYKIYSK